MNQAECFFPPQPEFLEQARVVALAVSQGVWGAIPGPFSTTPAPIHEDVVEVVLSGGQVSTGAATAAAAAEEGKEAAAADRSGSGDGGGGGGSGGGGQRASLWLSLPFVAALLPGASPATRQQAAMSINIALKVRVRVLLFLVGYLAGQSKRPARVCVL